MPVATQPSPSPSLLDRLRQWSPHFWLGANWRAWGPLWWRNRFRVSPGYIPIALADTVGVTVNTVLGGVQQGLYARAVRDVKFDPPPLFVIGHWRTGTTLLHELLACDVRNVCPTTYQCFCPSHFLLTQRWLPPWLGWFVPSRRPMDNMAMGWNRPQEDEFAIANLGLGSPYCKIAFPNRPNPYDDYFELNQLSEAARRRWLDHWRRFLQGVLYGHEGKRLVLKSPTHTARIRYLLEAFPAARFVHLSRDPRELYSSTVNLWKKLYKKHGYQRCRENDLPQYVIATLQRMYRAYENDYRLIPPGRLVELPYEALAAEPLESLRNLYADLELGDIEPALPAFEAFCQGQGDYKPNRHQLDTAEEALVAEQWRFYAERFGYSLAATS